MGREGAVNQLDELWQCSDSAGIIYCQIKNLVVEYFCM